MINFCPDCSHPVEHAIPQGEDRIRAICNSCETVHYQNPRVITGTIPVWKGKVLLCRRNIQPRIGLWTLPAGFLELNETSEEGAIRETWEESQAKVNVHRLHGVYNIPRVNQIYMLYLAELTTPKFAPTPESSEVQLFSTEEFPWDQLAFKVVEQSLKNFLLDSSPEGQLFHSTIA